MFKEIVDKKEEKTYSTGENNWVIPKTRRQLILNRIFYIWYLPSSIKKIYLKKRIYIKKEKDTPFIEDYSLWKLVFIIDFNGMDFKICRKTGSSLCRLLRIIHTFFKIF